MSAGENQMIEDQENQDFTEVSAGDAAVRQDISKMLQDPAVFAEALREVEQHRMGEFLENMAPSIRKRVKALKKLQLDAVQIEADFYRRVHQLECDYAAQFAPLNEKRKQIVTGQYEPTDEEASFPLIGGDVSSLPEDFEGKVNISNGPASEEKAVKISESENQQETGEAAKGIPEFWLQLFRHVDILADMIQEHDEPILKHLIDVEAELLKEPLGYILKFHFTPNDYFTNAVLTKEYKLSCQPDATDPFEFDGPEIIECKGCSVDWKPGKNVTVKLIKKKQKHKQRGQTRFVTKQVKTDSFFNFFDPPDVSDQPRDSVDEDIRDILNADFEIGQILRDRVIPRAVLYFTGEAHDDSFDEEDEDEDLDEEDDEDEDFDEDDDGPHQQIPLP